MVFKEKYKHLIQFAKNRHDICNVDGYVEKHHIIPKCFGGSNKKSNVVKLTAKEHFKAHEYLYKFVQFLYGDAGAKTRQMLYAWNRMRQDKTGKRQLTEMEYSELKYEWSRMNSGENNPMFGKPSWNKGIKWSNPKLKGREFSKSRKSNISKSSKEDYKITFFDEKEIFINGIKKWALDNKYSRKCLFNVMIGKSSHHRDIIKVEKIIKSK